MLFTDIVECDDCPFSPDNVKESGSLFPCSSHPDSWHPCQWMENYEGMTCEQVVAYENKRYTDWENRVEEQERRKREAELKKKAVSDKRTQTRRQNSDLNKEIARLRNRIKKRENAISQLEILQESINFANRMTGQAEQDLNISQIVILRQEIRNDVERIGVLMEERKRRNAARRQNND